MTSLDPLMGLPVALAIRLLAAAGAVLAARHGEAARRIAFLGSAVASLLTGLVAVAVLAGGTPVQRFQLLHGVSGFELTYAVDALSAWFLLVLSVVAVPLAVYSLGYVRHPHVRSRSAFIGAGLNILLGTVELVFTAADVFAFLCAWELMTLATAALVATDHEAQASRRAAFLYLVMSHVGTGCLIAGFLVLASASGSTAFAVILAGDVVGGTTRQVLFLLFVLGFGVKAGIVPLHIWLPEAHPAAPTNVSALMWGVLVKTGIYGMVRVCAFGLGTPDLYWGVFIVAVGGASAVLGVLYALMQHDLKRLLAYHSIENIGIILLGLGAGMMGLAYGRADLAAIGTAAGLYHVMNHAVFKALLFLGAGNVVMAVGTKQIEHFGGLLRRMPWTGALFLVGALAISGLPPLNGFVSEWLTFQAFLFGFRGSAEPIVHLLFPLGGALLALTAALAAACFVKAFGITFLALPRSPEAAAAVEQSAVTLVPQVFLAATCIALGLFPGVVLGAIERVTIGLPGMRSPADFVQGGLVVASGLQAFDRLVPAAFAVVLLGAGGLAWLLARRSQAAIRRVPTWGCGGELTAQTEYTATAFSKPIMLIFGAIYRPTRLVEPLADVSPYFPREVRYSAEIEPTFERHVYDPLVRTVMRAAEGMKMLQAGSLHAYLAYVIALVVGLVLFVWWRS